MAKYRVKVSYRWDYEVEADNALHASEIVESIMVQQEECGDLGAPDGIDEDIEKLED